MDLKLELKGITECLKSLDKLEKKIRKRELRRAITAGARPIRQAAKANVPVRFGFLKKSIIAKVKSYASGNVVAIIGPRSDQVYTITDTFGKTKRIRPSKYAHLVEFGAASHEVPWGKGTAHHPGSKAYAFMRKAVFSSERQALAIIRTKLSEALARL